jgi:hypothetical protein
MKEAHMTRTAAARGLLAAAMCLTATAGHAESDPRAVKVADEVMKALGGKQAWDKTRYLRFDFGFERDGKLQTRAHTWDKWTGRYRLEGQDQQGRPFVVLMNVNTRDGQAWVGGQRAAGEEEKKLLERAYGTWINDTYWLLMPYKLRDPGVTLGYEGETKDGAATYDKLVLTFENVGLTPKDKYWVWVNRDTRLVDRWDFVLKGEDVPPTTFLWTGWRDVGGVKLAGERVNPKDKRKLVFPVLEAPASLPDRVFTSSEPAGPSGS